MTYAGALVMPTSYAIVDGEEMTYVEGGGSAVVRDSIIGIRDRLTKMISASLVGGGAATALGGLLGGPAGAVISGIIGGGYFDSYRSHASDAHSKVERLILKYGKNRACTMTTTYSVAYYCTGISVALV